jgi:hypothetical protein
MPESAALRCCLFLDSNGSGQREGQTGIAGIAVTAEGSDGAVKCTPTNAQGCAPFFLAAPGLYAIRPAEEAIINGCKYSLESPMPVYAYLESGQTCSEIAFGYRAKTARISISAGLISAESRPEWGEARVTTRFANAEFLLFDKNKKFLQQVVSRAGEAVAFDNLSQGTHFLVCNAAGVDKMDTIEPAAPYDGRPLLVHVFRGQTADLQFRFQSRKRSGRPTAIGGRVTDRDQQAVSKQLVQLFHQDEFVAATLTGPDGKYKVAAYAAVDRVVVGNQVRAITANETDTGSQLALSAMAAVAGSDALQAGASWSER